MKYNQTKRNSFLHKLCLFLFILFPVVTYAQNTIVTGKVLDQQDEAIIGATVAIKGTTVGVVTDIDGVYSIEAPSNATLTFSYIGMKTQEIAVNGQSNINVTMAEVAQDLDEVVVIGYGKARKGDLTTSIAGVSAKDFADRPIISTAQALQGKAPGVQVIQPSGKPGVGMSVRVRGSSSLNAGNEPLYVVDGVPTNDISNLSSSDIQDMQILKDASSAAIYGARAANGVVLITTKQGAKGESKISLSIYGGFSNVGKKIKTLNTEQYYDLMDEIYGVGYVDRSNKNYTNWNDETFSTGTLQNYQLGISGGNDKSSYYVSAGYQGEIGIVKPSNFERMSVRSNINTQVKPWLKMSTNLSFSRTNLRNAADNLGASRGGVILSVLNTPPFLSVWDEKNPGQYATNPFNPSWENPLAQASVYDRTKENRFMGNMAFDFSIIDGLKYRTAFSVDYSDKKQDKYIDNIKTSQGRDPANNGLGTYYNWSYTNWVFENILTFDKTFNQKHNLNVLAGLTLEENKKDYVYMNMYDYVKGAGLNNFQTGNLSNHIKDWSTTRSANSLSSVVSRIQYNYESRYLLTANFRADGSSKLHPDHRWGYFPSVSAGWRISSENFFEPLTNVVNDLKLRAGWGKNGNQGGIEDYTYRGLYDISRVSGTGSGPNWARANMYNKDLKWETTTQYNAGIDIMLIDSRISLTMDAYYKKTKDLLLYTNIGGTGGLKNPLRNGGEMENKGFEFNITSYNLTGNFKWDTNFNMSFNKNELTKLQLTSQYPEANIEGAGYAIRTAAGRPLGSFYGYVAHGVDPDTGSMIYEDRNGNGYIDPDDRTYIGNAQPDFIFGMTNNFSWKGLTLSVFLQGSYGNDIYNVNKMETESMRNQNNQRVTVLDRWQRPGMITEIPKAGDPGNYYISSRFIEDGSYLRVKSVTLSYDLKRSWIRKIGLQSMNIYVTGNNLLTLTKYSGYDPEVNMDGGSASLLGLDYGTYPQNRSFIFGTNITF